jgi:adenylate kinase family enzyme
MAMTSFHTYLVLILVIKFNEAPPELIREAIVQRLKQNDCRKNGWVLDGFPNRAKDAEYLEENGIFPNRLLWLDAPRSVCWDRLSFRRYEHNSSKIVNIKKGSPVNCTNDWLHDSQDQDEQLQVRFKEYEFVEHELKKVYGVRNLADRAGIIDCISSCGVGEPEEGNTNESMDRVWETVKAHLLRPIPLTAIN